jgi:RND family efflux transporter MFP subunit
MTSNAATGGTSQPILTHGRGVLEAWSMRWFGKLLLPVLVVALALGGAGYLRATRPMVEPEPVVEKVWNVRATAVRFADHQPVLELFGDVVATRERTLEAPVAGRVVFVATELVEGGRVEAGTVLVRLDPFTYEATLREREAERRELRANRAELELNQRALADLLEFSRQRLEIARREYLRYEQLEGRNVGTQAQLDAAQSRVASEATAVRQVEREIESLTSQLDRLDAQAERLEVALERARRDLDDTIIEAPADALVQDVQLAIGKEVRAFDPLATLIDEAGLEIRFALRDAEFGRLWEAGLIGRELEAVWRLGATEFPLRARVERIQSSIDASQAAVAVYARLTANPEKAPLRPGAFLHIRLPDRLQEDVAALPATALFAESTIYAIDEGRLVPHRVEVVDRGDGLVLVKGSLDEGRPVLTSRLAEIQPGLRVEIVE